ncbi:hypothetical protein ACLKA7_007278 [Drosophila subpalustris]
MSLALASSRTMKASRGVLAILLICGLLLSGLPVLEALEEGDSCTIKDNQPGICRSSSKCEPIVNKYFKTGRLNINDIPSCGLGTHEEIVCCPSVECCPDEPGPRQVDKTTTTTKRTTTTRRTTTTTTTTTRRPTTSKLDKESSYFDFQQLLNGKTTKRPSPVQVPVSVDTHGPGINPSQLLPAADPTGRRMDRFQDIGPLGPAPNGDRPKIINRPQSLRLPDSRGAGRRPAMPMRMPGFNQDPGNLIQLVNDRLRQQGMNIVPANEVTMFEPAAAAATTTTTPTPAPTIANYDLDLDPWAPFRFRPSPADELSLNELGTGVAKALGPETTTTRTIQPRPTNRVDTGSNSARAAVRACRKWEDRQNLNGLSPHILEGIPVEDGIYPHMAAIAFSTFGRIDYRCGGSLISTRHVLTAAHCVNTLSETPVHVRMGSVNIEDVNQHVQDIPVTGNITIHPEYVSSSKYNDIAILELARDANLSYYTYPACLETNPADPPANAKLFVAGWGVMNQTNRRTSKVLLRAPLNIVPLDQCKLSFNDQPTSKRFLENGIIDSLLCAADGRRQLADACQGDSGGPLVLERDIVNSQYTILGVISSGFGCATKTPGLYSRVASYLDFIESVVWPNNVV